MTVAATPPVRLVADAEGPGGARAHHGGAFCAAVRERFLRDHLPDGHEAFAVEFAAVAEGWELRVGGWLSDTPCCPSWEPGRPSLSVAASCGDCGSALEPLLFLALDCQVASAAGGAEIYVVADPLAVAAAASEAFVEVTSAFAAQARGGLDKRLELLPDQLVAWAAAEPPRVAGESAPPLGTLDVYVPDYCGDLESSLRWPAPYQLGCYSWRPSRWPAAFGLTWGFCDELDEWTTLASQERIWQPAAPVPSQRVAPAPTGGLGLDV